MVVFIEIVIFHIKIENLCKLTNDNQVSQENFLLMDIVIGTASYLNLSIHLPTLSYDVLFVLSNPKKKSNVIHMWKLISLGLGMISSYKKTYSSRNKIKPPNPIELNI